MVKHVILWKLKEELTAEEKENVKAGIKEGLEGLAGKVHGLVDVKVNINGLPTSTVDVMLDTTFTDADAAVGASLEQPGVGWNTPSSGILNAIQDLRGKNKNLKIGVSLGGW